MVIYAKKLKIIFTDEGTEYEPEYICIASVYDAEDYRDYAKCRENGDKSASDAVYVYVEPEYVIVDTFYDKFTHRRIIPRHAVEISYEVRRDADTHGVR